MGYGDELMATGMARGLNGKRAAFGDGKKIIWGPWSEEIFRHNPKIARPGEENASDIEWVEHYKGKRAYNSQAGDRWAWNMDFRPTPGEIFFDDAEQEFAKSVGSGFVLVEPNLPWHKSCAPNKDWGAWRYQEVANRLLRAGHRVFQFAHGRDKLAGVGIIYTQKFRHALAALSKAALYVGPEGGLHHGAAAVGIPAVVIFGGFIPVQVTGYDTHHNFGADSYCGSLKPCAHCRAALDAITVEQVTGAACSILS